MRIIMRLSVVVSALAFGGCDQIGDLPLGAAYVAKNVCNGLYVSHYDREPLLTDYVTRIVPSLSSLWRVDTDDSSQTVSVGDKLNPGYRAIAVHRPPLGCVNLGSQDADALRSQAPRPIAPPPLADSVPWPQGNGGVTTAHLAAHQISALENRIASEYTGNAKTVATVVIHQQQLIHERYASGLDASAPVKGYSMSKSVVNALAGRLYALGQVQPEQRTGFSAWQADQRRTITLDHLLRMTSGLSHQERAFGTHNDQAQLLYSETTDPISYALAKPLALDADGVTTIAPGTRFNYSSQDNLLAAKLVQDQLGSLDALYRFYQRDLFHPIKITTAVLEHGRDGYLLSPEGALMSARDWARLGLLYLNRGVWDGNTVLPAEWIDYTLTPTEQNISYGAGIALNTGGFLFPDLPEDSFAFMGAWERYVVVIPSHQTIVVRIGFSQPDQRERINRLVKDVLAILE